MKQRTYMNVEDALTKSTLVVSAWTIIVVVVVRGLVTQLSALVVLQLGI